MSKEQYAIEELRRAAREHGLVIGIGPEERADAHILAGQTKVVLRRAIDELLKVWSEDE